MSNPLLKDKYYQLKTFLKAISDISFRFKKLMDDPEFNSIPLDEANERMSVIVEDARYLLQNAPKIYETTE